MLIYCVDDDQSILELVTYTLKQTGFEAVGFENGKELFNAMKQAYPDLIILDIMLENMNGLEILGKLRADSKTTKIPIIMATAKGTEYDKVHGLDSGADDYLVKPFGMMELVSRVRALLRRTNGNSTASKEQLTFNTLTLNRDKHQVYIDGTRVALTMKEFELLEMLMEHQGAVLSRDMLLNKIWGYDFDGETRTVDVHIRSLRKKLAPIDSNIKTVHGIGYRLED